MPDKFTLEEIREFWERQAREHGLAPAASWSDQMLIELEIREISGYLADGDHVLDVGCGNGFSTIRFAAQRRLQIRGLDYIPEMIDQAQRRLSSFAGRLRGALQFAQGDITALPEPPESYDKVVAIRVIINLGEWPRQARALQECSRVLKTGGTLLLSEATIQGWQRLNQFRTEWGLPDIPMPPFNQYLDERQVVEAVSADLDLVDIVNFASTYYVGTRVLKPLLNQAIGGLVAVANPNMDWNRWLSYLPAWGDYGTQKLFVFRKR